MGTTLTAAVLFNHRVIVGHVGDSRCYLVLDDTITQLSKDHSWVAEEVEAAIKAHADVYDCVVAGRPSDRWGFEVVAVVRLRAGCDADEVALLAEAERHIARYKLPKAFVFVDEVVRSPSGKADYRWAKEVAAS